MTDDPRIPLELLMTWKQWKGLIRERIKTISVKPTTWFKTLFKRIL